jgi:hypothetical protein
MNARASKNYLAISRSSSPSKSVEIYWAEIYWGRLLFRAEFSLIQSSYRSFIRAIVPYDISKVNFRGIKIDYNVTGGTPTVCEIFILALF